MRVLFCDSCGAPLDAPWHQLTVVCRFCGNENLPGRAGDPVPASMPVDGRPRLNVAGRTYVVEGLLAEGESTSVYRGRWVMRLGELVVVKVLRAASDADLMRREYDVLERLQRADEPLGRRLPQPIAIGAVALDIERTVAVYGWKSGFVHTLEQVLEVHPSGVDGRVVVWVFKRLLELLGWVHRQGVLHGAVLPPHVLVHPRDHGAMLVGWSTAVERGERLPAVHRAYADSYPTAVREGAPPGPTTDLVMAARCALRLAGAGGWFSRAGSLPGGVGALVLQAARGEFDDAWALRERLDAEALRAFGPPSYNPLQMPGWPTR